MGETADLSLRSGRQTGVWVMFGWVLNDAI